MRPDFRSRHYQPGHPYFRARWGHKRRFVFMRFAALFVPLMVILWVALGVLDYAYSREFGGRLYFIPWFRTLICMVGLLIPMAMVFVAGQFFRRLGGPLANIMEAADQVAEGDLSVQVPETYPGEMGQLARSFNRMTRELARQEQQRRNLTADVAHELRTPLHVLQGNLEGIIDGVYQPDAAQINTMLDETRLLNRLVEDLRTISLAEMGELSLKIEPVNVNELLTDVATTFSGQAEAAGLDLKVISPTPLEPIYGDEERLSQVIGNLLANALRHTPAGGSVSLQAEPLAGSPPGVRIRVIDTGEGISAEDLPFVFDRFWRGDPARTRGAAAGTGLGLAICRQLVQAHGGKIHVDSQPGSGSTFTIDLPASPPPKEQPTDEKAPDSR